MISMLWNYHCRFLEKIRFSITRLKLQESDTGFGNIGAWKDKILDYEIETGPKKVVVSVGIEAWKDKILDYEIETLATPRPSLIVMFSLKR